MKKSLVALAALAVVGAASAQSSVTLYGVVDASLNYASSGDVNKTSMGSSQLGSSKLGFMGSEDLGGGLKANFKLEGGLNNDSGVGKYSSTNNQSININSTTGGGLVFQRYSYVGLSSTSFGEIRLGRDYVNAFLGAQAAVVPFGTNGPADSTNLALKLATSSAERIQIATNVSNMFEYTTPSFGGFSANVQYWMGENTQGVPGGVAPVNTSAGDGVGVLLSYANGPIFASIATATTKFNQSATNGDYTLSALSASYNFGRAKVVYTYAHEGVASIFDQKNDTHLVGVIVPMGAANLKASYMIAKRTNTALNSAYDDQKGTQLGLGVDYALSKRTVAYATYANVTNSDGVATSTSPYSTGVSDGTANNSSNNVAIGIKHAF
jgi:predicted porin